MNTATLRGSAAQLSAQAATLQDATAASLADGHGQYGHAGMARAAGQLAARWSIGLSNLATDVRAAGTALEQVADSFEQSDQAAAGAARQLFH